MRCAVRYALALRWERYWPAATFGLPPAFAAYLGDPDNVFVSPYLLGIAEGDAFLHVADLSRAEAYQSGDWKLSRAVVDLGGARTGLLVQLRKDGRLLGALRLYRQEVRPFSEEHIALLRSFAAQAVVAMENARLITEQREALEHQTATAEVLQVINASPGDLAPVFDAMLEKALALCGSAFGTLNVFDGEMFHVVASRGLPAALANYFQEPITPAPGMTLHRVVLGEDIVHVADLMDDVAYRSRLPTRVALVDLGGARTQLIVSLRKDNKLIGVIMVYRREVRRYTDKQIALLTAFAAQAVIAMENARLLGELRQRTDDLQELLEYQTATSDVLKVISRSAFDLDTVLNMLMATAVRLCGATHGHLWRRDGEVFCRAASHMNVPAYLQQIKAGRGSLIGRVMIELRPVQIADAWNDPEYEDEEARVCIRDAQC